MVQRAKILMILFLLIAFIGISIGAEGFLTTTSNIELIYPSIKSGTELTKSDMIDFNGISYEVKGDTIILNKKNVFQNREIKFNTNQTCLETTKEQCLSYSEPTCLEYEERKPIECNKWEDEKQLVCLEWVKPKDCLDFDKEKGVCLKYETELNCLKQSEPICLELIEATCSKWTTTTKQEFISQAIQKEIEFVKNVQIARSNKVASVTDTNGKIIIK